MSEIKDRNFISLRHIGQVDPFYLPHLLMHYKQKVWLFSDLKI